MIEKSTHKDMISLRKSIRAAKGDILVEKVLKGGFFLDVFSGRFIQGDIAIENGIIAGVLDDYSGKEEIDISGLYIVPGFIDSHVHIESSLMDPARFQECVLPCGTTSAIWDPHEIANVKGLEGIKWAIQATDNLDMDIFLMIPSCVPSTSVSLKLETSGSELKAEDLQSFRNHPRVLGLAEMMDFPGLLNLNDEVVKKLFDFQKLKRDGHCPKLSGKELNAYGVAGIHSCHETTSLEEAREKMTKGIHVLIREGSCAKDASTLLPIMNSHNAVSIGLCSDDRNPMDIEAEGHINYIVNLGLEKGIDPIDIFRASSYSTAKIYGLNDRGAIAPGYKADLLTINRKGHEWRAGFDIIDVYKSGKNINHRNLKHVKTTPYHWSKPNLHVDRIDTNDLRLNTHYHSPVSTNVIGVIPGKILTKHLVLEMDVIQGTVRESIERDVLKIIVIERYNNSNRKMIGFVNGFGLKEGAIATSINHDSHNLIAVGASDEAITKAMNKLIDLDGGIVVMGAGNEDEVLQLPIGGLMTDSHPSHISKMLKRMKELAKSCGCKLEEPFLHLSFLALPVIPDLKITDQGLIDVRAFKKIHLFNDNKNS